MRKKCIAAEMLLEDKRITLFPRSEQGGYAVYAAMNAKNPNIAKGIVYAAAILLICTYYLRL